MITLRVKTKTCLLSGMLAIFMMASGFADNSSQDEAIQQWEINRQRYDLIDEEKSLLRNQDQLSYAVFDLKQKINQLQDALSLTQTKLDDVRHRLITVRMKLIP